MMAGKKSLSSNKNNNNIQSARQTQLLFWARVQQGGYQKIVHKTLKQTKHKTIKINVPCYN